MLDNMEGENEKMKIVMKVGAGANAEGAGLRFTSTNGVYDHYQIPGS